VTVYRATAKEAIAWKDQSVFSGRYSHFLLRHGEKAWDVYGEDGKIDSYCSEVVSSHIRENTSEVDVNADTLLAEAIEVTMETQLQVICRAESHAGARAVDHANFTRVVRALVIDASDKDLRHIYLVDSRAYDCRTVSVCANLRRMSLEAQNAYLDMHAMLKNSVPLDPQHHLDVLASRLSRSRDAYVGEVIRACCIQKGGQELATSVEVRWHLADMHQRHAFCTRLTHLLSHAIVYEGTKPETFVEEAVMVKSLEILDILSDVLNEGLPPVE